MPLRSLLPALVVVSTTTSAFAADELTALEYRNPDLVVDLGVGLWAWPLPMDFDRDGDLDLVVSCPDKPYNGTYFFENRGGADMASGSKLPVFEPGVRIGPGYHNIRVSHVNGEPRVLVPGREYTDFRSKKFDARRDFGLPGNVHSKGRKIRANQWHLVDFEGDGDEDIVVGVGEWADYGWDDAWDAAGKWRNGPLHGYVYLLENEGGEYAKPVKVTAGGEAVDVYGWPSPNFADFDGDGDLDLLCGEFLDGFTYYQNVGSREEPRYSAGRRLKTGDGKPLRMDLQMIVPTAIDWDGDGDQDLVVGDEDGRVAFVEHSGLGKDGLPRFASPVYLKQRAKGLKFGALATPVGFDWDGDGDEDLLCGNTAGHIGFFENLDGGNPPKWAAPRLLEADGETIRIQAGPNGSIQGPAEAKWGYTTLTVADWDHDELPDLVVNSIWGQVVWYRNVGTRRQPKLAAAEPIEVSWEGGTPKPEWTWWDPKGKELVTQWRTTPVAVDWNDDDLCDLVMLDHEGYLSFFERTRQAGGLVLGPGRRIFVDEKGGPLRLNPKRAGGSGRRKLCVVDWDGDGRLDLLANSVNADLYRNLGERDGKVVLEYAGPVATRRLAGHTSSPAVVDWNRNGVPDLLVGAEDGRLYHLSR